MKTPSIQLINDTEAKHPINLAIYQTAQSNSWKKVTVWHLARLGQGGSASVELLSDYSIGLKYVRNEMTITTKRLQVAEGIGAFRIGGKAGEIELRQVEGDPNSGLLEVVAERNFKGPVELLIFKGKERVFPAVELNPGASTSPQLNGDYYVALMPNLTNEIGADIVPELVGPKVKVRAGDKVTVTGTDHKGYALSITPGIGFPS